ncbi:uncharacterized protein [Drosophila bipectinata]|uniref:uncharacterized protein n=1 Tax=Drosophila bipectinata TaxID=42026 RepID=UPI001C8ACAD3|nr:uncharacterized protein LOC108120058 [Drosophila bipectinata]
MNHLKWMGHSSTIMDIQRSLRNDSQSCEVVLASRDGVRVRAHLFVLSTCSDLMRNILVDVLPGQEATIMLPDIRGELLESMLSFIYMGETSLPSASLSEFLEAINLLGIKSAISFECNPSISNHSADVSSASTMAVETAKSISGLQIAQAELLEDEEEVPAPSTVAATVMADPPTHSARSLEYLDVYDPPKITYSIEHMDGNTSGNQYILTENTGTFTITQTASSLSKLTDPTEAAAGVADAEMAEEDVDADGDGDADQDPDVDLAEDSEEPDTQILEEEYVATNPPFEIENAGDMDDDDMPEEIDEEILEVKPRKFGGGKPRGRRSMGARTTRRSFGKHHQHQQEEFVNLKRDIKDDINDALDMAADAVILEGLSLQKAADRFDISKTVLWRRVRTNPAYMRNNRERPSLSEAYERLKNGDSLKSISQDLRIPMSTLHRHKVRLSAQGRLPDFVACRRRDTTPKDELRDKLAKAVHACLNEGMSQNHAANLFEIPKSTLWRHLQRQEDRKVKKEQQDEYEDDLLN